MGFFLINSLEDILFPEKTGIRVIKSLSYIHKETKIMVVIV